MTLFLWLLGGDFAFIFFETIFSQFIPLYLKELNASNVLIGVAMGSVAGFANIFFLPRISRWSDRYRSRWGRRIPFLFIAAPITSGLLIFIGFVPEVGGWLFSHFFQIFFPTLTKGEVVLGLLSLSIIFYHFFNMILVNAFNWLVRDVVPQFTIARFMSWFKVVGTVSSCLFLWYVFPHVLVYRKEVCLAVGLTYLSIFMVMCFRVKEGEYPPPSLESENPGIFRSFVTYFRECLKVPKHRHFFIAYTLVTAATSCATPFLLLFAKETLKLDMTILGRAGTFGGIAALVCYMGMGWLCDKVNPINVMRAGLLGTATMMMGGYFMLHDQKSWIIFSVLNTIPTVAWALGSIAVGIRLFPKEKFGQFSSGLSVFGFGGLVFFNFLMGKWMDVSGDHYRYVFIWSFVLFSLALIFMGRVYEEDQKELNIAANENREEAPFSSSGVALTK
ncbi:MAG: MFS transporter [Verrucomicrobiota bacterium]